MKFVRHKIGSLCHNVTDGEHGTVINEENGDYYLLSNKNIKNGRIVYNGKDRRINNESFNKINKRTKLEYDDVVIATVGTIGRTAIIKDAILKYDFQRSVGIYKVNKTVLLPEFLHYYFQLPYVQKRLINLSTGAVQKCLFIGDLKNIDIDLPTDFNYQSKIVKVLSDLDAKIELNNKINLELEAMAKLIYDYWFVQFDFPNENGKPYKSSGGLMVYIEELKREIPEGWEVKGINEVIEVKDGTHDSPKSQDNGFKLITSKHLKKEGLDFESANYISEEDYININKRSQVNSGDILFSMIGNIGTVYKIEEETIDFAIKNVALYKISAHLEMKNYVYMYLRGYDMQRYMGNVIAGSIQKFIGLGSLRKMPLMNDSDTISKFAEKTKFIFKEMNVLKVQNQKLAELRDWLLPMLMNGQVQVV